MKTREEGKRVVYSIYCVGGHGGLGKGEEQTGQGRVG